MSTLIFQNVLANLPQFDVKDYENLWVEYPKDDDNFDVEVFDQADCLPYPLNDNEDTESLDKKFNYL